MKVWDCVDHNKFRKFLQEMGVLDHFTCLLRNLYSSQEATVRTGHGTTDWFEIGKGVQQQHYILSSYSTHLTYVQSVCSHAESLQWCLTLCNPVTLIHQAYLSMGFSRQYWSRLPFFTPGHLPNPGIKPESLTSTCIGRQVLSL